MASCNSSPGTQVANGLVTQPSAIPKPLPLPPIQSLQKFLNDAYVAEKLNLEPSTNKIGGFTLPNKEASISILMIADKEENKHYAEIHGTNMQYSGSQVKVGALYAAFDLRAAARIHAKNFIFSDQNSFFTSFASTIDTSMAVKR